MLSRALFLSLLLPGAGQIMCRRPLRGLLLCVAYTLALAVAILRALVLDANPFHDAALLVCLAAAAATYFIAQWGMLNRLRYQALRKSIDPARNRHFNRGLEFFVAGSLTEAEREFQRALGLDPDDADACFYLVATFKENANLPAARRWQRHCLSIDHGHKWEWQLSELMRQDRPTPAGVTPP